MAILCYEYCTQSQAEILRENMSTKIRTILNLLKAQIRRSVNDRFDRFSNDNSFTKIKQNIFIFK